MVETEDRGAIRIVKMNRPEALNAFDGPQFDALAEAMIAADEDGSVKVVVLTGEGRAFSAGLDLTAFGREQSAPKYGFPGLFSAIINLRKPLLLAVNGLAIGFGTTILGLADLAFVAESARFRAPFTSLGLCAEAASTRLFPQLVGRQQATWILMSSEWFDARTCKEIGLAVDVFPDAELMPRVLERAETLAALPGDSLMVTKALIMDSRRDELEKVRATEDAELGRLSQLPAHKEAINAFREKRAPDFSNL